MLNTVINKLLSPYVYARWGVHDNAIEHTLLQCSRIFWGGKFPWISLINCYSWNFFLEMFTKNIISLSALHILWKFPISQSLNSQFMKNFLFKNNPLYGISMSISVLSLCLLLHCMHSIKIQIYTYTCTHLSFSVASWSDSNTPQCSGSCHYCRWWMACHTDNKCAFELCTWQYKFLPSVYTQTLVHKIL